MNIAVFVSGRGSNLRAILDDADLSSVVKVKAVLGDKTDCGAYDIAKEHEIPVYPVSKKEKDGFTSYAELLPLFRDLDIDAIILAGFLKLIPSEIVRTFENKILNIHPALLPAFGGKGMYGSHVHQAVFDSGIKVSGATIHFVNEEYDKGYIVAQECVDISNVQSPDEIAKCVLKIEHSLYPRIIKKFAEGKVTIRDNRVFVL